MQLDPMAKKLSLILKPTPMHCGGVWWVQYILKKKIEFFEIIIPLKLEWGYF